MKTIAFYLPQYHPIPENDQWWGKGFTEWTNVAKARPRFPGHYQPQIPADLGFYDLRFEETRVAQADLAKMYGIDGFCYYHYWFNGKMLLERPLNEVLESGKPDFPFCICWANENWTRRWDGLEQEILIRQNYEHYDVKRHFDWLAPAFADSRYIKIDGKPLFVIYRPGSIENIEKKVKQWKSRTEQNGFPGLYLVCTKNFTNPWKESDFINMGFDAFIDFQPQLSPGDARVYAHSAFICDYKEYIRTKGWSAQSEYTTFPCVFPSWDNSARRKTGAYIIQNNDPQLYKKWLIHAFQKVQKYAPSQQIVFINAWNEWAEGCHLEPDLQNGHAFLKATKEAVNEYKQSKTGTYHIFKEETEFFSPVELQQWLLLIKKISGIRPLYIWGTGTSGVRTLELLQKAGVQTVGFFDNNELKWGTLIAGVTIFSPRLLKEDLSEKKRPYIIISSMYYADIKLQLNHQYALKEYFDFTLDYYNLCQNQADMRKIDAAESSALHIFCNVCSNDVTAPMINQNLADICPRCGSNIKDRLIMHALKSEYLDKKNQGLKLLSINWQWKPYYWQIYSKVHNYMYFPRCFQGENQTTEADFYEIPYENDFFDIIVLNDFRQTIIGLNGYRQIYRKLKKEGLVLIVTENSNPQPLSFTEQIPEISNLLNECGLRAAYHLQSNGFNRNGTCSLLVCKKIDQQKFLER